VAVPGKNVVKFSGGVFGRRHGRGRHDLENRSRRKLGLNRAIEQGLLGSSLRFFPSSAEIRTAKSLGF